MNIYEYCVHVCTHRFVEKAVIPKKGRKKRGKYLYPTNNMVRRMSMKN